MKKRFLTIILCFCILVSLLSCQPLKLDESLRAGDLLFQDLNCGELCNAIEAVTKGVGGKDFSHCGMVVNINDTLKVVEAIGDKVQINALRTFFTRSGDTSIIKNITIARVRQDHQSLVEEAANYCLRQIGKPYDQEFLLDNGSWYCSELLYAAFKESNSQNDFFDLKAMTFINPRTKTFFPAWVAYYKELNKGIPEGKLGVNPGSISLSDKIRILKMVY